MIKTKLRKFDYNGMSGEKLDYMISFDFDYNFIVGGRSNFKTSTLQEYAVKRFLKTYEKSIRLVRNLDNAKKEYVENFFTPVVKDRILKDYGYHIIYEKSNYWLVTYDDNGDIVTKIDFMKIVPLSKYQTFKSNNLEAYTTIIFDEFAPEDGTPYLRNEISKLINFVSTVNRNRTDNKLKVYLIGNMISVDNIYFDFYGIDAFDLTTNNIYDFTIEDFQRVGVLVVDPVFDDFKKAPRILRSHKMNVQETSQNKYEIPKDIIDNNDIFIYMLLNYPDEFKTRFKLKYVLDVTNLDDHDYYLGIFIDKFNARNMYILSEKFENSDIYMQYPKEYLKKHTTHTVTNSIVAAPVWSVPFSARMKYADRVARKLYVNLKETDRFI